MPEAGFDLETVAIRGLDRDAPWKNLALPFLLPAAMRRGRQIVDGFRPDVVLGTGGYAMAPAVRAARDRGIPYVLMVFEPGGLANRLFYKGAAAACTAFADAAGRIPVARVEVTGYPIRDGFRPASPQAPPRRLLVIGGSQGARRLNLAVWAALDGLLARFDEVVHLTGAQGESEAATLARPGYRPLAFSTEVAALMAAADLVVCRAGVGTLAEVTAVGLPAVVVPGTFGGGHQESNAAAMVAAGAAVRVADAELDGPRLLAALDGLDPDRLRAMARASAGMGRVDAARRVVAVLREVAA